MVQENGDRRLAMSTQRSTVPAVKPTQTYFIAR